MAVAIATVQSPHLFGGSTLADRNRTTFHKHLNRLLNLRQGEMVLTGRIHHVEILF